MARGFEFGHISRIKKPPFLCEDRRFSLLCDLRRLADGREEPLQVGVLRIVHHIFRRTDFGQNAFLEKGNAIRDIAGKTHLVCHDDHGHALRGQKPHDVEHFTDKFGVKCRGGLVKQHIGRFHRQRAAIARRCC